MKRLLNTLYVTTPGAYLSKEGETVVIKLDDETKKRVPIHTLGGIVCFGSVGCTPYLMAMCVENGIGLTFLTEHGKFLARITGRTTGSILLRRKQYERSGSDSDSLPIARSMVLGKLANYRSILQRANRDQQANENTPAIETAIEQLRWSILCLERLESLDELRGIEGEGSRQYFGVIDHLISVNKDAFFFHGRSRRPPRDNVNCMLSFAYTLLMSDCRNALESYGLDPQAGFLHRDRPGRPSLALDLMEEFRGPIADRLVLSLINRQQVQASDYKQDTAGSVTMSDDARKQFLIAYQERKQDELLHPFLEEKVKVGLLPHLQAQLLAKHIRGELDSYPPFIWK